MKFARWTFLLAGIYGVLVTVPLYFLEHQTGLDNPPPINHPEYYYGFAGLCVAWQIVFLIIAKDPIRLRPIMLGGVLEKVSFVAATVVLHSQSRVAGSLLIFAAIDALLAVVFVVAYLKTPGNVAQ